MILKYLPIFISRCILLVQHEDKFNILNKKILKFKNNSLSFNNDIDQNTINNIKIIYIYKVLKIKIIKKINAQNSSFPDILKKNIIIKLNNFEDNINSLETQKIMDKIVLLKEKFIL